jgi:hypothetical protein
MLKTEQRKPQVKILSTCYFAEKVGFYTKLENSYQPNRDINLPVHIHTNY